MVETLKLIFKKSFINNIILIIFILLTPNTKSLEMQDVGKNYGNICSLDSETANYTYLKLDSSNDPLTGSLEISSNQSKAFTINNSNSGFDFLSINFISPNTGQLVLRSASGTSLSVKQEDGDEIFVVGDGGDPQITLFKETEARNKITMVDKNKIEFSDSQQYIHAPTTADTLLIGFANKLLIATTEPQYNNPIKNITIFTKNSINFTVPVKVNSNLSVLGTTIELKNIQKEHLLLL